MSESETSTRTAESDQETEPNTDSDGTSAPGRTATTRTMSKKNATTTTETTGPAATSTREGPGEQEVAENECPECGGHVSRNEQRGETVCSDCGLVLTEAEIDHGKISRMSSALDAPDQVEETACQTFKQAHEQNLQFRGRSIEGIATACLHISFRIHEVPRGLDTITNVSRVDRSEIARTQRYITRELSIPLQPMDPIKFIPRFASDLGLTKEEEKVAEGMLKVAEENAYYSGKSPTGLAAAAIYIASMSVRAGREKLTQSEIADVAEVTEVTIRNRYKEIIDLINGRGEVYEAVGVESREDIPEPEKERPKTTRVGSGSTSSSTSSSGSNGLKSSSQSTSPTENAAPPESTNGTQPAESSTPEQPDGASSAEPSDSQSDPASTPDPAVDTEDDPTQDSDQESSSEDHPQVEVAPETVAEYERPTQGGRTPALGPFPYWTCPHCDRDQFTSVRGVNIHIGRTHSDEDLIKQEDTTETSGDWDCPHCDSDGVESKTGLNIHIGRVHPDEELIENRSDNQSSDGWDCPHCVEGGFKGKRGVNIHIGRTHPDKELVSHDQQEPESQSDGHASEAGSDEPDLDSGDEDNNQRAVPSEWAESNRPIFGECPHCDRDDFADPLGVNRHINRTHEGEDQITPEPGATRISEAIQLLTEAAETLQVPESVLYESMQIVTEIATEATTAFEPEPLGAGALTVAINRTEATIHRTVIADQLGCNVRTLLRAKRAYNEASQSESPA